MFIELCKNYFYLPFGNTIFASSTWEFFNTFWTYLRQRWSIKSINFNNKLLKNIKNIVKFMATKRHISVT